MQTVKLDVLCGMYTVGLTPYGNIWTIAHSHQGFRSDTTVYK